MKNNITRFILVLFVLTITLSSAFAERVSQEDAAIVAGNFLSAGDTTSSQGAKAPARTGKIRRVAMAEEVQYYVYENADGNGWVMVAANDVAHPILAYSDEGHFRTDNQPANLKSWLGGYSKQIKYAEDNHLEASEEIKAEWQTLRKGARKAKATVVVSPLIKTGWDQDSPYWNDCPSKSGSRCYTGCVATAMAQVMNYWQWPETGTGSNSVTFNNTTYTVDFTQGNYDWANMKNTYSTSNATQKAAVAKLMYHCGVAVGMEYGTDGSAAYTINWKDRTMACAQNAFWKYFGYKESDIQGYYRNGSSGYYSSWTEAKWIQMLKDELDAGRPIMYAGGDANDQSGHSFVCDGYDSDNLFHFNWGWSNYCDGYYNVNSLIPNENGAAGTGAGGGNGDYSYKQDVIIGIQRPVNGHKVVTNGTGCTITPSAARVENGNSLTATITPTDATYDFTSITVKLGNTTLTSGTHYSLSSDKKTLTVNASAITGSTDNDLTITIVWTKNRYSYSLLGTNCTEVLEGMLNKNASLSLAITPDAGYTLADAACWTVEMGTTMLTYGTGFTYNSSTNTFSIASVTGDVTILAEAGRQVTWRAGGSVHATNVAAGDKITLPTDPDDCSETKKFVGWCTNSSYSSASTAPTFAKDNDNYTVATYYAVYATAGSGGGSGSGDYELVESAPSNWAGDYLIAYDGATFADGSTGGTSGIGAQNGSVNPGTNLSEKTVSASWGDTYKVTIEESSTPGKYLLKTQDGQYNYQASNANGITTTSTKSTADNYPLTITFNSSSNIGITVSSTAFHYNTQGYFRFYKNEGQSAVYMYKKTAGASYSDYTTSCITCSNTPSMSFSAPTTVSKTTADGSFTKAVTISGKGSGQTVAYSSSDETIATVTNAGVVTLKGKGGSTTITASVEANGTYCAASASYTLNVTCALSGITLNTSSVKKEFGIGETFSYSGLVVTANYTGSGCPSGTVTPTSVSTPNMSSAGTKTVTVSYTENGTTKTATYQITVKASHTVTWMACGSQFKQETYVDGASLVLPSPAPGANTAGKAFAGWTTAEYTGATAPTLITAGSAVNADATYYAVYH